MNTITQHPNEKKIQHLKTLLEALKKASSIENKINILNETADVQLFKSSRADLSPLLKELSAEQEYLLKSIIAIGQAPVVLYGIEKLDTPFEHLIELLQELQSTENFYDTLGGLIGYYVKILELLQEQETASSQHSESESFQKPEGVDISKSDAPQQHAIRSGIEYLSEMCEIYVLGGAGDRLNLIDPNNGEPIPVALLPFCGRTLLKGIIRDLIAKEYLYYKLTGMQLTTPVAMMASYEKNNLMHVYRIIEEGNWFGRPKDSFRIFVQPSVPVITKEGHWVMKNPLELMLKPGGHGVMWKQAIEEGVFEWFGRNSRRKVLVRQINNPVAGTDGGILAFTGIGCEHDKDFGFASCPRRVNAAEGVDVLKMTRHGDEYSYAITNIEYVDFKKKGIIDEPITPGGEFSVYPANTNILFGDLSAIENAIKTCPIPGMIVNTKNKTLYRSPDGAVEEVPATRLESTMQNIADFITSDFGSPISPEEQKDLRTYLTYNDRIKTISVCKIAHEEGKSIRETPEGCYFDLQKNAYDLLKNYCYINLPESYSEDEYLAKGPSVATLLSPSLGPLYTIIAQKIHGGTIHQGSELVLDIAEVNIKNLDLDGSLIVEALDPHGFKDSDGVVHYGEECGKCFLKNVTVRNRGIDRAAANVYWKNEIIREEALKIILHGNAEFYAEDVMFEGDDYIEVPSGYRVIASQRSGELEFIREPINRSSWSWQYSFAEDDSIVLTRLKENIS